MLNRAEKLFVKYMLIWALVEALVVFGVGTSNGLSLRDTALIAALMEGLTVIGTLVGLAFVRVLISDDDFD